MTRVNYRRPWIGYTDSLSGLNSALDDCVLTSHENAAAVEVGQSCKTSFTNRGLGFCLTCRKMGLIAIVVVAAAADFAV